MKQFKLLKKNFILYKKKNNFLSIYKTICTQIPSSIFRKLGYKFFLQLISEKIIDVYCIKNNNKIVSIITFVTYENYFKISRKVLYFLIFNPHILIKNLLFLIKSFAKNKDINISKNDLHLLHLVIFKKYFAHLSLIQKDKIFNFFFLKLVKKYHTKSIFLCFEKNNLRARKYYSRNKYKIFDKQSNIIFLRKYFN